MFRTRDGYLYLKQLKINLPYLKFIREESRGANGIVYKAIDLRNDQPIAFKIWTKLKRIDGRNKLTQGIKESTKYSNAKEKIEKWIDPRIVTPYFVPDRTDIYEGVNNIIVKIHETGFIENKYFFAVYDFIEGVTLKKFMMNKSNVHIPFGIRYNIALRISQYNGALLDQKIIHGDLHWNNIMLTNIDWHPKYSLRRIVFDLKIIDFGTSYFSNRDIGINRNTKVLIDLVNKCIHPFILSEVMGTESNTDSKIDNTWIQKQLFAIRAAFFELEAEFVGWPLYRSFGTYLLTTKGFGISTIKVKELINKFKDQNQISLTEDFLGHSINWDSFDGRYAKRGD